MASRVSREESVEPSAALGDFVSGLAFEDVPDRAIRLAERCFVDTVGVAVAGASARAGDIAAEATAASYPDGPSTLVGRDRGAPAPEAAFANGTASHALDYDDVSTGMDGHPSATMVAPLLATAEVEGASGRDVLAAFVAGFETQCYVAAPNRRDRTGPGLHPRGWHPTAVFGTFGAAAAVSHLLGLDAAETRTALDIAASMPAGLKRNFGSLAKPMHAGQAGAAGIRAARLAQHGFDATPTALAEGFFPVYAGVETLDPDVLPALGETWSILDEGVDVKRYPSCHATHTSIHALSSLADEHDVDPGDVARIDLDVNPHMVELLVYDDPETEAQAKFSIPHTAAVAVAEDYVGIATFEPETVAREDLARLRDRVHYDHDPERSYGTREVTVRIETAAGETYTRTEDTPPGAHEDPLSTDLLREKFLECANRTIDREAAETAYARLDSLRDHDDVSAVTACLAGGR